MFRSWNSFGILIMTVGYGRVSGVCSRTIVDLSMSRHNWSIVVMAMAISSKVGIDRSIVAMGERVMLSMGRHLIMVMTIIDHMGRCRLTRVTSFRAMASIP